MDAFKSTSPVRCANPDCAMTVERPRRFCSDRCRKAERRNRTTRTHGRATTLRRLINTGQSLTGQKPSTKSTVCNGENGDLQNASPKWIEVNEVTWKLTDGVMERTPASHGQWGGFNVERGLAWCMEVGWPFSKSAWYARCGDKSYGPTDLKTAKKAALAFANGANAYPENGLGRTFDGEVNLHADPDVAAEMRRGLVKTVMETELDDGST
jgi:hypothetical protein